MVYSGQSMRCEAVCREVRAIYKQRTYANKGKWNSSVFLPDQQFHCVSKSQLTKNWMFTNSIFKNTELTDLGYSNIKKF